MSKKNKPITVKPEVGSMTLLGLTSFEEIPKLKPEQENISVYINDEGMPASEWIRAMLNAEENARQIIEGNKRSK